MCFLFCLLACLLVRFNARCRGKKKASFSRASSSVKGCSFFFFFLLLLLLRRVFAHFPAYFSNYHYSLEVNTDALLEAAPQQYHKRCDGCYLGSRTTTPHPFFFLVSAEESMIQPPFFSSLVLFIPPLIHHHSKPSLTSRYAAPLHLFAKLQQQRTMRQALSFFFFFYIPKQTKRRSPTRTCVT